MTVDGVEYSLLMVSALLTNFIRSVSPRYLHHLAEYVSRGDSLELDHIKEGSLVLDLYLCLVEC